jgi:hypothetical protein
LDGDSLRRVPGLSREKVERVGATSSRTALAAFAISHPLGRTMTSGRNSASLPQSASHDHAPSRAAIDAAAAGGI